MTSKTPFSEAEDLAKYGFKKIQRVMETITKHDEFQFWSKKPTDIQSFSIVSIFLIDLKTVKQNSPNLTHFCLYFLPLISLYETDEKFQQQILENSPTEDRNCALKINVLLYHKTIPSMDIAACSSHNTQPTAVPKSLSWFWFVSTA